MRLAYFITHPDVVVDPRVPIPRWPLSPIGRERMAKLLSQPWAATLGVVYSSDEQKAIDGAEILAKGLGLRHEIMTALGEIDRSSTGYLTPAELWPVVDDFFRFPDKSSRGWETAADAQRRIVSAVESILDRERDTSGNIAIVSHGAVSTLYLSDLMRVPISRAERPPGKTGGNYFCFDAATREVVHGWREIEEPPH